MRLLRVVTSRPKQVAVRESIEFRAITPLRAPIRWLAMRFPGPRLLKATPTDKVLQIFASS